MGPTICKHRLSVIQVLGLLQAVSQLYPNKLQKFLNGYTQTTSAKAWVSLDCSLPVYESISKATITTLIYALQPAYVVVGCWVLYFIAALYYYQRARWVGKGCATVAGLQCLEQEITHMTVCHLTHSANDLTHVDALACIRKWKTKNILGFSPLCINASCSTQSRHKHHRLRSGQ